MRTGSRRHWSDPGRTARRRNDRVRLDGARNLVAVAGDAADRFLFPSVVWVARQPDGSQFDEAADRNPTRATRSAAETEAFLLHEAAPEYGNDRFREAVGWEPTYPTCREGLEQVVAPPRDDGTVREADEGYEWAESGGTGRSERDGSGPTRGGSVVSR